MASSVMLAVTVRPLPMSTFTVPFTAPGVMAMTRPGIWLRALSFMDGLLACGIAVSRDVRTA